MTNDAAALHSSIFAWSAHLEVVKGFSVTGRSVASTPQWPQHRLRAIQAVNAKLNDPRQALEVSTLLAVGNLMAANVSQAVSIVRSAFFNASTRLFLEVSNSLLDGTWKLIRAQCLRRGFSKTPKSPRRMAWLSYTYCQSVSSPTIFQCPPDRTSTSLATSSS